MEYVGQLLSMSELQEVRTSEYGPSVATLRAGEVSILVTFLLTV